MKKTPLLLIVLLTASLRPAPGLAQTNALASLGSGNFAVDAGSTTIAYTQSSNNLTLGSPFILGDTLGGIFTNAYDWSAYSDTNTYQFGLFMSAPAASPVAGFTIEFFNGALDAVVNAYQGSAFGLTTNPTFVPVDLSVLGTDDFSSIGGLQFTWDVPGSGAATLEGVAVTVVPEPSTWAMLILGGLLVGGVTLRRRLAMVRR